MCAVFVFVFIFRKKIKKNYFFFGWESSRRKNFEKGKKDDRLEKSLHPRAVRDDSIRLGFLLLHPTVKSPLFPIYSTFLSTFFPLVRSLLFIIG